MVDRIDTKFTRLPPTWISRATRTSGNIGQSEEIRKLLGEPIPRPADPKTLRPEIAAMFEANGVLGRIAKKLRQFSKRKYKKIIPAHNTIASVDEEDNIYVGVEFLENFGSDEALLAGILAHEWGHMVSDLPRGKDWSHLTWEELFDLRKEEEAYADGFSGRMLYLMGYKTDGMIEFLKRTNEKKKKLKLPDVKYHNTATRIAILEASYEAQERAFETAEKLFSDPKTQFQIRPKKILGQG